MFELGVIRQRLPQFKIINPKHYQKEYLQGGKNFEKFFYGLIDISDALIFSYYDAEATEGVANEVAYAISKG